MSLQQEINELRRKLHEKYVLKEKIARKRRRKVAWIKLKSNPRKYQERLLKHRKECERWRRKNSKYMIEWRVKLNKLKDKKECATK